MDEVLDSVAESDAVVLCGGPGYATNFYPGVFPLTRPLSRVRVPIIPMGIGWSGQPQDHPDDFQFTEESLAALRFIHDEISTSSVRDPITHRILLRQGFSNVLMTGDPATYSLPDIDSEFVPPDEVRRVVVTEPASPHLYLQAGRLMRRVRNLFPGAEAYFFFHRDLHHSRHTSLTKATQAKTLSLLARALGFRVVDASYNTARLSFYRTCDLHIGYRVHACLYFLSVKKPTFLIAEDGRGLGQMEGLRLPGVAASQPNALSALLDRLKWDLDDGFSEFDQVFESVKEGYQVMSEFLSTLPTG